MIGRKKDEVCNTGKLRCTLQKDISEGLAFRELEALACSLLSVLLSFLHSWVTCQEPERLQSRSESGVHFNQRSADAVSDCARLSHNSAAVDIDDNVILGEVMSFLEWLLDHHVDAFAWSEMARERLAVHNDFSFTVA